MRKKASILWAMTDFVSRSSASSAASRSATSLILLQQRKRLQQTMRLQYVQDWCELFSAESEWHDSCKMDLHLSFSDRIQVWSITGDMEKHSISKVQRKANHESLTSSSWPKPIRPVVWYSTFGLSSTFSAPGLFCVCVVGKRKCVSKEFQDTLWHPASQEKS